MLTKHGGDIQGLLQKYKINRDRAVDFSVNINPLGITPDIAGVISMSLNKLKEYPDPGCNSARQALARYWGLSEENFLLGNGSNELIHLIPRALKCKRMLTCQPAFSEYALSAKLSGLRNYFIFSQEKDYFRIDIKKIASCVPKVGLILLGNPNNPTGNLTGKGPLINLAKLCKKNKTYLVIDEVFMDFVDKEEGFSLLRESVKNDYLLVLRSFTKFFSLPGLRIGYLTGKKETVKRLRSFQPAWSVNSLAQEAVKAGLNQLDFIEQTKRYIKREKEFLFEGLSRIKGLKPYYPNANFIFCKIMDNKLDSGKIFSRLIKSGIIIRDCSNFKGLDKSFFRVGLRSRKDNLYLLESLRRIFK